MKKLYEMPKLELNAFDTSDVITTSNQPVVDNYLDFTHLSSMEE